MIESIQYQAGLLVSGCWQGTNREELYKEVGWESLEDRRLLHRLTLYFKIRTNVGPTYLNQYVLHSSPVGTDRFKRSFFHFCFNEWESMDMALKDSTDHNQFKSAYRKNIRPVKNHTYEY